MSYLPDRFLSTRRREFCKADAGHRWFGGQAADYRLWWLPWQLEQPCLLEWATWPEHSLHATKYQNVIWHDLGICWLWLPANSTLLRPTMDHWWIAARNEEQVLEIFIISWVYVILYIQEKMHTDDGRMFIHPFTKFPQQKQRRKPYCSVSRLRYLKQWFYHTLNYLVLVSNCV